MLLVTPELHPFVQAHCHNEGSVYPSMAPRGTGEHLLAQPLSTLCVGVHTSIPAAAFTSLMKHGAASEGKRRHNSLFPSCLGAVLGDEREEKFL